MSFFCENCKAWGIVLLRVVLAIILINHGAMKLFGDTTQLLAFFESTVLPAPAAMLLISGLIEFIGGIAILLGCFNKIASYIIALQFAVIILFVNLSNGLLGLELDLLIFASVLALSTTGPGKWSMQTVCNKMKMKKSGTHGGHGKEAIGG